MLLANIANSPESYSSNFILLAMLVGAGRRCGARSETAPARCINLKRQFRPTTERTEAQRFKRMEEVARTFTLPVSVYCIEELRHCLVFPTLWALCSLWFNCRIRIKLNGAFELKAISCLAG